MWFWLPYCVKKMILHLLRFPRMHILQCLQVMCHLPLWLNVLRHRPPFSESIVNCIWPVFPVLTLEWCGFSCPICEGCSLCSYGLFYFSISLCTISCGCCCWVRKDSCIRPVLVRVCDIETALQIRNKTTMKNNNSLLVCLDRDSESCQTVWLNFWISFSSCTFFFGSLVGGMIITLQYGIFVTCDCCNITCLGQSCHGFLVRWLRIILSACVFHLIKTNLIGGSQVSNYRWSQDIVSTITCMRQCSACFILTFCVLFRTLCHCGPRCCGCDSIIDIIIAIDVVNVIHHW